MLVELCFSVCFSPEYEVLMSFTWGLLQIPVGGASPTNPMFFCHFESYDTWFSAFFGCWCWIYFFHALFPFLAVSERCSVLPRECSISYLMVLTSSPLMVRVLEQLWVGGVGGQIKSEGIWCCSKNVSYWTRERNKMRRVFVVDELNQMQWVLYGTTDFYLFPSAGKQFAKFRKYFPLILDNVNLESFLPRP